ncbi:nucleolar protein 7 [Moschus berezovskii]|uniref:Nucleolar protein 7 n=1 Tax=Moschus moschiferus TaxID=68415 RepID=A0A8C6E9J1_MOSMO|nr:nucleolar protein 7 [Moschus berezovskii]
MRLRTARWGLRTCRGRQSPGGSCPVRHSPRACGFRVRGEDGRRALLAARVMVQLRPRASRAPASASAMVDEGQPASEEEAGHGLLLGQPSSGAAAEPLEEDEEGDDELDDEAPEELTFASAQAEAKEEERRVRETVRRDRALLKEKRKRREELFIEQKKRKLLPDTILEKLTTASQTSVKKSPGKLKEVNLQKKNEGEKGSDSKKTKVQKVQTVGQNKSYKAVRLKDQDLRDSRQEAAKAFIQNCLYGPGTNRTTVNKFLSLENKRLPMKKAAAQFLNNTWGSQRKQNAKRYTKRWMVRKMKTPKK